MAKSPVAGQPAITRAGCYDSDAAKQMQDVTCNGTFTVLAGATDPVPFPGNVQLNAASADACTLATPIAGQQPAGDDGKTIFLVDSSGKAHTVTTAANAIINSKHILTWNGTIGSNCLLMAMGGVWVPVAVSGVTVS
jgi:hypothetical protein